ncbi:MAG: hypothetical protein F6K55_07355 [Moorea sp. SIO4A3]|nr:hypothetical protein [Moorena sp. SIO4A3]
MRIAISNSFLFLPCSLFPIPYSLFPKTRNYVPHEYNNCYILLPKIVIMGASHFCCLTRWCVTGSNITKG